MGYNDSEEEKARIHKTWRVVIVSVLMGIIALFLYLYKTDSWKPDAACKDEFIEFVPSGGCAVQHKCSEGATIELVTLKDGKSGTMCHCTKNIKPDAGQ